MSGAAVGRITLFVLAGLAAGLLTWFVSDGSGFIHLPQQGVAFTKTTTIDYYVIFITFGVSIAVLLGLAEILAAGQGSQWIQIVGIGVLVGAPAGIFGGIFGMTAFGPLYSVHANSPLQFLGNVLARAIGWAMIGALAGTASGWRKLSIRVGRNGFFGGLIGGSLGGAAFEIFPYLTPGLDSGGAPRFLAFLITGAFIGLFVGLVQELFKEAWVRIVLGRNEGREILVEKAETRIGRAELSDIALYGDPIIAKTHALLIAQPNGRFILRDVSQSQVGVRVNDAPVDSEIALHSGDQIRIGSRLLVFYERMTRERTAPERRDVAPQRAQALSASVPIAQTPVPRPAAAPVGGGRREITAEAHLVATTGPYTGTVFPVRNGAVAGRDPQAEIALPADTKASRSHARFVYQNGAFSVEDCGSTNGTYVNGRRVTSQSLAAGDTVVVGTTTFRFE